MRLGGCGKCQAGHGAAKRAARTEAARRCGLEGLARKVLSWRSSTDSTVMSWAVARLSADREGSWQEDERKNGAGRPKSRSTGVRERRLSGKRILRGRFPAQRLGAQVDQASTETLHGGCGKCQAGYGTAKRAARTEAARRCGSEVTESPDRTRCCQACGSDRGCTKVRLGRHGKSRQDTALPSAGRRMQHGQHSHKLGGGKTVSRPGGGHGKDADEDGSWQEDERKNGAGRPKSRSTGVPKIPLSGKGATTGTFSAQRL